MANNSHVAAAGAGGLVMGLMIMLLGANIIITSNGNVACETKCISHVYITAKNSDFHISDLSKALSMQFDKQNVTWSLALADDPSIPQSAIQNLTIKRGETLHLILTGYKEKTQTVKWTLGLGDGSLDPYWYYNSSTAGSNYSVYIARNYTALNFTCFAPYMNNTEPAGQDWKTPAFNVTNIGNVTLNNITLALNANLNSTMRIYCQPSNYVNPASIILNTTAQKIITRLTVNQSKGIWCYGYCLNVTDNQSVSMNFTFGGG